MNIYIYMFIGIGVPEIQNGHSLFMLQTSSLPHFAMCMPVNSSEYVHIFEYDIYV